MRFLLVDDETKVCSALRLLLEQEPDWHVATEISETESLLAYFEKMNGGKDRTEDPIVLLLDWELPGLNREKVLPVLREKRPDMQIVALSARSYNRPDALELGVDAFISKNDPPDEMLSTLHALVEN
jgi:DNA-binding NarL/FixJ family response regulator